MQFMRYDLQMISNPLLQIYIKPFAFYFIIDNLYMFNHLYVSIFVVNSVIIT